MSSLLALDIGRCRNSVGSYGLETGRSAINELFACFRPCRNGDARMNRLNFIAILNQHFGSTPFQSNYGAKVCL